MRELPKPQASDVSDLEYSKYLEEIRKNYIKIGVAVKIKSQSEYGYTNNEYYQYLLKLGLSSKKY